MYIIKKKYELSDSIFGMDIEAPRIAKSCQPGQFLIVHADKYSERIPLTIADYDREKGIVTVVVQKVGSSTEKMSKYEEGDAFESVEGPLGKPSDFLYESNDELKKRSYVFIGGGLGNAPIYPQVKWMKEHGIDVDVIMGARTKELIFWEEKMNEVGKNVYVTTDDGSYGRNGRVTDCLENLVTKEGKKYTHVIVIGPMIMMKFVCQLTDKDHLNIPTIVSMNPVMVDGTGMCGACRLSIDGEVKFACVDGPEFDGHKVNFDQAMQRLRMYKTPEGRAELKKREGATHHGNGGCHVAPMEEFSVNKRVPISEQDPQIRSKNFDEVCLGYTLEEAMLEATRCLDCKKPRCVDGCPVSIDIPGFIRELKDGNVEKSFGILKDSSALPAVCGRVCPQEEQCEGVCVRGIKGEAVAIGKLERFVADYARTNNIELENVEIEKKNQKVAIIGAGPAGLTCAGDLQKLGYDVTIFESLHMPGGVLSYGIPEFRLPKDKVVKYEIDQVEKLGVKIETDVFVGRTVTINDLKDEGFEAVFIASGAGLPMFMDIPGENANGVFSANEYLTRANLMHAYDDEYDTDVFRGKKVVVVGGGNVAMDAARTALRLNAESIIVYRRSEEELPARREEVLHAKEEGVQFRLLQNPVRILTDESGWVSGIECIRMELKEPDASGRRRPVAIEGSEFTLDCDMVIMALGTKSNPIALTGMDEVEKNRRNGIVIDEETGMSSVPGIFAGGDAVTGSATVILAMGAGRKAAKGIDEYLKGKLA